MNYRQAAEALAPYISQQRRWFHRHPELPWQEAATTAHIREELTAMGLEPQPIAGSETGCTALLRGNGATARTVLLRADIDALPVCEETGLPFASENPGVMHACGHDCHAAMLLGAARLLTETRQQLPGNVCFLFQPAEEAAGGAAFCVEHGILEGVDAAFGQHVWGTLEEGKISVQGGPRMASCDNFLIEVTGTSAHGSAPHLGADAIVGACAIVMALQTVVSRRNDPANPFVLTVGEILGGQRFNIIPNRCVLKGTYRTYSPTFRDDVVALMRSVMESTASAMGVSAVLTIDPHDTPLYNRNEDLNRIAHDAAVRLYGEASLGDLPAMMSSEDFSWYADRVPAFYAYLGSKSAAYPATNHNDHYDVNEAVLPKGAALHAQFAFDYLCSQV